ncbi:MAG: SufS family cysteine desulfurase [Propionibacteriaceae bacterium]|jgi:cysteine desulfurase/selenocysteine lyase|nr:SufS family cysteine desulfurase [Propionibacteriaceae bacterium]
MTLFDDALLGARRADFPILNAGIEPVGGKRTALVYLDSANTSQKPEAVLKAVDEHYRYHNANVARAMHTLGAQATAAFEGARDKVAAFVGGVSQEIVFTKNASEALNLAAYTLSSRLSPGDEVVISVAEHHSNLVPWQMACQRTGATLRWFDVTDEGRLDLAKARADHLINEHTKVVSITALSNVTGALTPIREIADWAHRFGAVVIADGSQYVPHNPTSVADMGVDMLAFTGHKMLGPTGIGVLWGKYDLLDSLPPFLGGGEMIEVVRMAASTYARPPHRFEAGTPPIAQAVGLGAAVDYLNAVEERVPSRERGQKPKTLQGMSAVAAHDATLTEYALDKLLSVPDLHLIGPKVPVDRGSVFAFTLADVHPHDAMQVLDSLGIAVRGGHHCARPLHERFGVQSSIRVSTYLYTTTAEIDALVDGLMEVRRFFKVAP